MKLVQVWTPPPRSIYYLSGRLCFLLGVGVGMFGHAKPSAWIMLAAVVVLALVLYVRDVRTDAETSPAATLPHPLAGVYPELDAYAPDESVAYLTSTRLWYIRRNGAWHELPSSRTLWQN